MFLLGQADTRLTCSRPRSAGAALIVRAARMTTVSLLSPALAAPSARPTSAQDEGLRGAVFVDGTVILRSCGPLIYSSTNQLVEEGL